jgi:hypothetical protein
MARTLDAHDGAPIKRSPVAESLKRLDPVELRKERRRVGNLVVLAGDGARLSIEDEPGIGPEV